MKNFLVKHAKRILYGAVGLSATLVYLPSLQDGFVTLDDPLILLRNPEVIDFHPLRTALDVALGTSVPLDYIPLTIGSFALEHKFFGFQPFYYHFDNLLLYVLICLLVTRLFLYLTENTFTAAVAAFLFAVHPVHAESVAWITERKDVLCGVFFALSFVLYCGYVERKQAGEKWRLRYGVSVFLFLLSMLSKSAAITYPAVLIAYDWLKNRPLNRAALLDKLPYILISGLFALIHVRLHAGEFNPTALHLDAFGWVTFTIDALTQYLSSFTAPFWLSVFYETNTYHLESYQYILAELFVALTIFTLWKPATRRPAFFGVGLFGVMIFPALQIVTYGNGFKFADRYLFLPSIGLSLIAALALSQAARVNRRAAAVTTVLTGLLTSVFAFATAERGRVWFNDLTLWGNAIENYPNTAKAHADIGSFYYVQGKFDEAMEEYKRSILADPKYGMGHNNVGAMYERKNQMREAIAEYRIASSLEPHTPEFHYNLGSALASIGDLEDSNREYETLLKDRPSFDSALKNLGINMIKLQRFDEAEELFKKLAAIPGHEQEGAYGLNLVEANRKASRGKK